MSSDDDHSDIGDELLALAGDSNSNKPRKKRPAPSSGKSGSSSKRRKQEVIEESDDEPESEEDESNPYPLDGKYKDELDRQNLMTLPETERERIISERLEERQKLQDKLNLERLVKAQRRRPDSSPDHETVSKAAKRKHQTTGKTAEKAKGLAALTEKRRAKKERDATKGTENEPRSPKAKKGTSDDEDDDDPYEDGQIDKADEEYKDEKNKEDSEKVTIEDLSKARITRDLLSKHCLRPGFEDFVKGGWVRYNFGPDPSGRPCYRICEVVDVGANLVAPYAIDDKARSNRQLELRHGALQKCWNMDRVSNAAFPQDEFDSLIRHLVRDDAKLPKKAILEKKQEQIKKYCEQKMTEAELQAMLDLKKEIAENKPSYQSLLSQKARLNQRRALAQNRRDVAEIAQINAELAELERLYPDLAGHRPKGSEVDRTAVVNERNRKANLEAVRLQEEQERERRKKALLGAAALAAVGSGNGGTGSGMGSGTSTPVKADLSARVKTMPKIRHEMNSRSGTPGTPNAGTKTQESSIISTTPVPTVAASNFETLTQSIELDLGDF